MCFCVCNTAREEIEPMLNTIFFTSRPVFFIFRVICDSSSLTSSITNSNNYRISSSLNSTPISNIIKLRNINNRSLCKSGCISYLSTITIIIELPCLTINLNCNTTVCVTLILSTNWFKITFSAIII